MGLRNAFEEIGLEGTLRKILAAVTYARTPIDQMRVVVDSGGIVVNSGTLAVYNASVNTTQAGQALPIYGSNTWNSVDARDEMREASEQHFIMTRNRWNIT